MLRKKGRFYAQSFDKYLSQGKHYLRGLYAQQVEEGHKEVHVEYTIRKVEIDGVPVTGTIDKIEYHPGLSVGIIDYKTGRVDEGGLSRPSDKKPGGGNLLEATQLLQTFIRKSRPLFPTGHLWRNPVYRAGPTGPVPPAAPGF